MAFQQGAFQPRAFQGNISQANKFAGRKQAKEKARLEDLAERYNRARQDQPEAAELAAAVAPFVRARTTSPESIFRLPPVKAVNFKAIAHDEQATARLLRAFEIIEEARLREQEEEESALALLL